MTDAVAELDRQVQRGSLFTQAVLQQLSQRASEGEVIVARLIDQLVERGLIDAEALGVVAENGPASAEGEPLDGELPEMPEPTITWPAVAIREDPEEPLQREPAYVDCAARMPVCHAVCCRLKFPLSAAEIEQAAVKWDIGHPYLIRHDADGCCTHNDRNSHGCTVYDQRPVVCRTYSCAGDKRIWSDFDNMVLNQAWIEEHLVPGDAMYLEAVVASMEVPVELSKKPAPA